MKHSSPFILVGGALAAPVLAAGTVNVTIPQLRTAEYKKPYVAMWVEPAAGGEARTLSIWYAVNKTGQEPGSKWLSELRSWWRKGGRSLKLPADGLSGATRAPGNYSIALPADLKPGTYVLNVEAARESGGREVVSLPISIPPRSASVAGKSELGTVTVSAK
jgi:hypothetical protein